jgi:hypothetical protein
VVDQGIGMTEEHMKPLFKPYYKVQTSESRSMNPSGPGLGLKISKDIAKMLNGDITFSSEMGIGSCFTFGLNLECVTDVLLDKKLKKSEILAPDMIRVKFLTAPEQRVIGYDLLNDRDLLSSVVDES